MSDEAWMAIFAEGSAPAAGAAARQQGAAAFEELFRRYRQPLYGFFRRRTADAARAEELTQECFLAVLEAGATYTPSASFRTFLYAIGLNLLRADRRKSSFRAMFTPDEKVDADRAPSADAHTELGLMVRDALTHLDRMDREMLMLRQFEELSYDEIAELLQVPAGTVRSRLFRARAAMRQVWTASSSSSAASAKPIGTQAIKQEGRA